MLSRYDLLHLASSRVPVYSNDPLFRPLIPPQVSTPLHQLPPLLIIHHINPQNPLPFLLPNPNPSTPRNELPHQLLRLPRMTRQRMVIALEQLQPPLSLAAIHIIQPPRAIITQRPVPRAMEQQHRSRTQVPNPLRLRRLARHRRTAHHPLVLSADGEHRRSAEGPAHQNKPAERVHILEILHSGQDVVTARLVPGGIAIVQPEGGDTDREGSEFTRQGEVDGGRADHTAACTGEEDGCRLVVGLVLGGGEGGWEVEVAWDEGDRVGV